MSPVERLTRGLNNKVLRKHLLTANTLTIASAVLDIESYLAVDNSGRLPCKAAGEGGHPLL